MGDDDDYTGRRAMRFQLVVQMAPCLDYSVCETLLNSVSGRLFEDIYVSKFRNDGRVGMGVCSGCRHPVCTFQKRAVEVSTVFAIEK